MKKLRLEIGDLTVETFETAARPRPGRGTVAGHVAYDTSDCLLTSACASIDPCADTVDACPDTSWAECGYSYGGTCGASPPVSYDAGCAGYDPMAAPGPADCV